MHIIRTNLERDNHESQELNWELLIVQPRTQGPLSSSLEKVPWPLSS